MHAKHRRTFTVLYVTTREGALNKMSLLPDTGELCLLEQLHLVPDESRQPITAVKLLSSQVGLWANQSALCRTSLKTFFAAYEQFQTINEVSTNLSLQGVLFVSTRDHVYRIPVQRCHKYSTRE